MVDGEASIDYRLSTMIKAFVFDLGNVLLPFSHERMYAQVAAQCGRDALAVRAAFQQSDLAARFERGKCSEADLQAELEEQLAAQFETHALHRAIADIFSPDAEMLRLVDVLKSRGYRLVLLSNTNSIHARWIEREYAVFEKFDACVFSYQVGALKPDPAIYAAAISRANYRAAECFYTDDIEAYVLAGRAAGLDAEVFTSSAAFCEQVSRRGIGLWAG